jgi:ribonuclease HII
MTSISDISKLLKEADGEKALSAFISDFSSDERGGVQKLVATANKKLKALHDEYDRIYEMKKYERENAGYGLLCGIDEVGRGPLAGPVMAAAVILPKDMDILYLNDSKKLTEAMREKLYDEIMTKAVAVSVGVRDHNRIDEINILNATYEAMQDAIKGLKIKPTLLLNDAVTIPNVDIKQVPIIKGDAKSASIAAASIIAKVTRDRLMVEMDKKYPGYGFAENKGYGTKVHTDALKTVGPCEIHRRSFIGNFI